MHHSARFLCALLLTGACSAWELPALGGRMAQFLAGARRTAGGAVLGAYLLGGTGMAPPGHLWGALEPAAVRSVASAAVNPMQDVGVGQFLVKDGGQHLRLALPSPAGTAPAEDPLRRAQQSLELVRLRLEQVGARAPVWKAVLQEIDGAEKAIASASGPYALADPAAVLAEVRQLRSLVRDENLAQVMAQQEVAADALAAQREALLPAAYLPYTPSPPEEFQKLPQLRGRATLEMVLRRAGKDGEFVLNPGEAEEGKEVRRAKEAAFTVVIDGYHAPITGAQVVRLAQKGFYDGQSVNKAEELIVQTGERGSAGEPAVPLELFYKGDAQPTYSYTSDEDNRATETFVLPFQAYGAVGMARAGEDADSATSQIFFLKWDQALVAPGRNTLDGFYTSLGYITRNAELLKQVQPADTVVSVKVLRGADKIVTPK